MRMNVKITDSNYAGSPPDHFQIIDSSPPHDGDISYARNLPLAPTWSIRRVDAIGTVVCQRVAALARVKVTTAIAGDIIDARATRS